MSIAETAEISELSIEKVQEIAKKIK
jgi:hypothetical protein